MRIVCLSDTHTLHDAVHVPEGDVLVHAGDFSSRGNKKEIEAFAKWFRGHAHPHKVIVAGNHDFLCERDPARAREILGDVTYLDTEGAEIEGLRFWGSPWQPWFFDWAFNLARGPELAQHWALAPSDVDVLVTHSPPMGCLDLTVGGEHVGCADLAAALPRIRPKLHVFGHIHEAAGTVVHDGGSITVNASNCDVRYRPVNPAVCIDWDAGGPRPVDG